MKIIVTVGCLSMLLLGSAFAKPPKSTCGVFLEQVPLAQVSDSAKSELELAKNPIFCRVKPEIAKKKACDGIGWTIDRMDGTSLYFCRKLGDHTKDQDLAKLCPAPYQKQEMTLEVTPEKATLVQCGLFHDEQEVCKQRKFTRMVPLTNYDATLKADEQAFVCEKQEKATAKK